MVAKTMSDLTDYFYDVATEYDFISQWSVYDIQSLEQPHLYNKHCEVRYTQHWGEHELWVKVNGGRYLDLWMAAEVAIKYSGDHHHIYIEGFTQDGDFLTLITGS